VRSGGLIPGRIQEHSRVHGEWLRGLSELVRVTGLFRSSLLCWRVGVASRACSRWFVPRSTRVDSKPRSGLTGHHPTVYGTHLSVWAVLFQLKQRAGRSSLPLGRSPAALPVDLHPAWGTLRTMPEEELPPPLLLFATLGADAPPEGTDKAGMSLLHHLARLWQFLPHESRQENLATLLDLGYDLAKRDELQRTPAVVAWKHGNAGFVKALFALGRAVTLEPDLTGHPSASEAEAFMKDTVPSSTMEAAAVEEEAPVVEAAAVEEEAPIVEAGQGEADDAGSRVMAVARQAVLGMRLLRERVVAAGTGPDEVFDVLASEADAETGERCITVDSAAGRIRDMAVDLEDEALRLMLTVVGAGTDAPTESAVLLEHASLAAKEGMPLEEAMSKLVGGRKGGVSREQFGAFCGAEWSSAS
jgi:hypothetical protein